MAEVLEASSLEARDHLAVQSGHVDFFARFGWYKQQVKGHFQIFTMDFFKNGGSPKVLEGATLMEKIILKVGVPPA